MLYYDRVDISKGIDLAKSNDSNECMIEIHGFLITGLNFKILFVTVAIIWGFDNIKTQP